MALIAFGADAPRKRSPELQAYELVVPVRTLDRQAAVSEGNQKSVVREVSKFDTAGRILEQTRLDAGGKVLQRSLWKFDATGVKATKLVYDEDGGLDEKTVYEHDKPGNIIAETEYAADGERRAKRTHTYDAHGRLIKSDVLDTDDNDAVYRVLTYEYDSRDRVIKMRQAFTERGFEIGGPFVYDILRARRLNVDLRATEHVYEYDSHDNIATDTWLSGETVIQRTKRAYKYDSHGNWTAKVETVVKSNGLYPERSEIAKRTMSYE